MARVFISHAHEDGRMAHDVRERLVSSGHEIFLDEDLVDGIVVGEEWQRRLHERLRWADAVICIVTSAYVASAWCAAEVGIAQSRGSRLLPLVAEPDLTHPLLSQIQAVPLSGDSQAAWRKVQQALQQIDATGGLGWPDGRSPFPGLRPFDVRDRQVFFGRSREIDELATLLRSPAERVEGDVLLVVGPSGSGKSSVVRAGLAPTIAADDSWLTVPAVRPGSDPVAAIIRACATTARDVGLPLRVADVGDRLQAHGLRRLVDEILDAAPGNRGRLLLIIDQFEEVLTQATAAERARFAELLRPALGSSLAVVATLRPEFLDELLADRNCAGLPMHTYLLRPLRREALSLVIEGPARLAGITIDDELVARMVGDTADGDALPLLAYTMSQLADGTGRGDRLSAARYEQVGGVQGALARQADAALSDAVRAGGRTPAEVIKELLRLVMVDEQNRPTRWRVRCDELPDVVAAELNAFTERRLLTTDFEGETAVIGVAHEAFLTAWQPLREAINSASVALRARRGIEQAATDWATKGRPSTRLWERGQLAAALDDTGAELRRRSTPPAGNDASTAAVPRLRRLSHLGRQVVSDRVDLSACGRDFLHASIRRDRWRRGRSSAVLAILLVLALLAGGAAYVQQLAAQDGQLLATSRLLVTQAATIAGTDPRTAIRLSEAAAVIHPDPDTRSVLVNRLLSSHFAGKLPDHEGAADVVFSPTGRTLASVGFDGTIVLSDLADPLHPLRLGEPLTADAAEPLTPAFAAASSLMAAAGANDVLVLWDLADPAHPRRVGEASAGTGRLVGTGTSAALSPDGGVLAAAFGESVLLWDLADPHAPRLLDTPFAASASFLAFDPVGRLLAVLVSGDDGSGQLVLWDLADPARPQQLGSPLEASGAAVTFSQDGKIMAFSGADGTVNLWDVTTPPRPQPVDAPRIDPTPLVALAPDGHTIAAVGRDNRIRLWDVSDKGQARAVGEPLGGMNSLAFSADSRLLATVSNSDRNVSLWDLAGGAPVQRVAPPPPDPASVDEVTPIFPGDLRRPMTSAVADHLLARTAGGKVYLCDLEDPGGNCSDTIPDTTAATGATFVRGARLLAVFSRAGGTGTVALWDVGDRSRPQHVGQFTVGLAGPVSDSPPATPGSPPTTSGDPTFEPVPPSSSMPVTMAVAPDGRTLATIVSQQGPNGSSSGSAILWDIANPALPQKMGELPDVSTMSFTGVPGSAATVDGNGALHFWDVSSSPPNHVGTLPADTSSVLALGGGILALAGQDAASVALWDVSDMTQPRPVSTLPTDGDVTAALSDDARTLAVGSLSGDIQLWDLTDPGQPRTLGPPLTAATPDGLTPSAVLLDDAGQTLAAIGTDSTVAIWNLAPLADIRDRAVAHACMVTRAGLDHDEWVRFVPSLEYVDVCAP